MMRPVVNWVTIRHSYLQFILHVLTKARVYPDAKNVIIFPFTGECSPIQPFINIIDKPVFYSGVRFFQL